MVTQQLGSMMQMPFEIDEEHGSSSEEESVPKDKKAAVFAQTDEERKVIFVNKAKINLKVRE